MNKKPEKKPSAGVGIIIAILALLWSMAGSIGSNALAGVAVIIVIAAVIGIAVYASKKSKSSKSADFQPSKVLTQQEKKKEFASCDDEHYKPIANDSERRAMMLNNMRKSGLIGSEEYTILKKRWGI